MEEPIEKKIQRADLANMNGKYKEAETLYNDILKFYSNNLDKDKYSRSLSLVWNNLGNMLKGLGRLSESEISFKQGISLSPNFAEVRYNLGNLLVSLKRLDEAETNYKKAIDLKPDYYKAYNNLGIVYNEKGMLNEAKLNLTKALAIKSDHTNAYLNLCEVLEKSNQLSELLTVVDEAIKQTGEKISDFKFFKALMLFREKKYNNLKELIEEIQIDELNDKRKPSYLKLKADWYHYKENYNEAFKTYKIMNEIIRESSAFNEEQAEKYFEVQKEKLSQIQKIERKAEYKKKTDVNWIQPTFLIGFPRSGTTLLDSILRSHSKINVVEEQPMLSKVERKLGNFQEISLIERIDDEAVKILSSSYFEELKKHCTIDETKMIIDKFPLNIFRVPIINKIFPNAKIIFAIRHPLDCIMSCWMQNFNVNPAMANMTDLGRIVDLYCTAMQFFKLCDKRYSLNIQKVRYEDLITDFDTEVLNILNFLNLKWEDGIKNYQITAKERGLIKTPSYSQVVKPIYHTSADRWKCYESFLEPFKKSLLPWFKDYGY